MAQMGGQVVPPGGGPAMNPGGGADPALANQQATAPAGQGAAPGAPPSADPGTQNADQMRSIMREEINAAQEKPPKLSPQERFIQLEGLVLRMMEHLGLVKPDPNLIQQQAPTGMDPTGMQPGAMPPVQDMSGQASAGVAGGAAAGPAMQKTAAFDDLPRSAREVSTATPGSPRKLTRRTLMAASANSW
jgi:hypothetical protein